MAYDPFRGPGGSYSNNDGYRYGDVGSRQPQGVDEGMVNREEYDNPYPPQAQFDNPYPQTQYDNPYPPQTQYDNTYPPHAHSSYSQPMYDMDPSMNQPMNTAGSSTLRQGANNVAPKDEFDPFAPPPTSTGDLRMWRQDHRGNLWNKGSRPRCIGRFFCCSLMTIVLLVVSILLTLAVFLRPPDVLFDGLAPIDANTIQSSSTSLNVTLGIDISVSNPNFFAVSLKAIKAKLTYPVGNTDIGGGEEDNIKFNSDAKTSFTFPLTLGYSEAADPQGVALEDIAKRCGFVPGSVKEDLEVDYTITIEVSVLGITVSPDFSGSVNFACPFTLQDMQPLIAAFPALQGLLPS